MKHTVRSMPFHRQLPLCELSHQSDELPTEKAPASAIRATPPAPVPRLLRTPYCTIDWDGARSLVRFVRTRLPYASIADIVHEGTEVERALESVGRSRLLVDLRAVVPRNDPDFEVAIAAFRRKIFRGGGRMAILVRTAVGALQVKRHMREDGFHVEVFSQEDEALSFFAPDHPGSGVAPTKG
jgi:hypothetical protein